MKKNANGDAEKLKQELDNKLLNSANNAYEMFKMFGSKYKKFKEG